MDPLTALYGQFDPLRPLSADENDARLYVDWQKQLHTDDVKQLLARSIALSAGQAVTRLFTGHRGVGKTTELFRVKRNLEMGSHGRKLFVSMLLAERWVALEDVQPEDIVFQMVRQLVADLGTVGFRAPTSRFREFFVKFSELLRKEVDLTGIDIGVDPLKLSFRLQDLPSARPQLRALLRSQLPRIYDLVNNEILKEAKQWLARPEHGGFDDILVIVDELDRIPQKVVSEELTNHEDLFLGNAGTLRSLDCDVLYTIPMEMAYSHSKPRLRDVYGADTLQLPVIPVMDRRGNDHDAGQTIIRQILERRVGSAGIELDDVFEAPKLLAAVIRASGGHVRGLFVIMRSMLDRIDALPISEAVVTRSLHKAAIDLGLPLRHADWQLLDAVHATKQPGVADGDSWYTLLRDLYVLAYEDADGYWYDRNPLLECIGDWAPS